MNNKLKLIYIIKIIENKITKSILTYNKHLCFTLKKLFSLIF